MMWAFFLHTEITIVSTVNPTSALAASPEQLVLRGVCVCVCEHHFCSKRARSAACWNVGGIRRAPAHGDRWGVRWTGGAGMCASVSTCVCVFLCASCALQQTYRASHRAGVFILLMCYEQDLTRKAECLFLPLNTAGGLQVLPS